MKAWARLGVPFGVVSETVFAPTVPAGVTAVTVVEFTTVTLVAAVPSINTPIVPVRLVPVIVIAVPPSVEPAFGVTEVTVELRYPRATRRPQLLKLEVGRKLFRYDPRR